MTLPIIYMDAIFLAVLLAVLLAVFLTTGVLMGRKSIPRGTPPNPPPPRYPYLLSLMAQADHILDNYITSFQGNLTILREDLPVEPKRWQDSCDAISEAADLMKRHLEQLRLLRMGLDENNIWVAPVNLARLLERILITLDPLANSREITQLLDIHRLTQSVPGNPLMFEAIFTTLLDNAIRHNPQGTEVVADVTSQDGMALVRISDNGRGIEEEDLPNIFEPGESRHGPGDDQQGTGMGLHIARVLTEIHGGTIGVESPVGRGTKFSVALPFERPEVLPDTPKNTSFSRWLNWFRIP